MKNSRLSGLFRRETGGIPSNIMQEVLFLALIIIASIILIVYAGWIKIGAVQPGVIGPAGWPRAMLLGLILSCVFRIFSRLRTSSKQGATRNEPRQAYTKPEQEARSVATGMVLVMSYVFLSELIGFALVSLPFLIIFIYLWGWKKKTSLLVFSIVTTLAIMFTFVKGVYVPLPKGKGIFEELTILLYQLLGIY